MEEKRVSFKVAKAIKEAGYPQIGEYWYDGSGLCCYSENDLDELQKYFYAAPYALEVWLWLWRERKIMLPINGYYHTHEAVVDVIHPNGNCEYTVVDDMNDPEDAIIAAIEYLVNNDLIK